jgi:bacterioferritin
MPDRSRSIANLQQAVAMELTAVQQYLLHAHTLDDWGLDRLAAKMREEMHEELGHAGRFIDRILFLQGTPRAAPAKTPDMATSLQALFTDDRDEEATAIAFYTRAAREAFEDDDIGTRTLFEATVTDEEGHWDWLNLQLDLLQRMGEPQFIAHYMGSTGSGAE